MRACYDFSNEITYQKIVLLLELIILTDCGISFDVLENMGDGRKEKSRQTSGESGKAAQRSLTR